MAREGEPEGVEGGDEVTLSKAPSLSGDVGCLSVCASLSFTSLPSANNLSHSARLSFLREPGLGFLAPGWLGVAVTLDPGVLASEMAPSRSFSIRNPQTHALSHDANFLIPKGG